MQTPSAFFNTLRERPGNHITQKCVIETGNWAIIAKGASASASSEFSSDWPASAVVNGDRTHINAGAAAAAEDGIGGGVWQGNAVAAVDGAIAEWVIVDLGTARRVNRIKIIFWPEGTKNNNLGAIGAKDFLIEEWDGVISGFGEGGFGEGGFGGESSFVPWSGLVDKCPEIGKSPTTIVSGQVTGNTNDMVVFEDPTPRNIKQLKLSISKLQAGSVRARIVAIEITWAVDVSDSVVSSSRRRSKDYHLDRRQATSMSLSLRNYDKRFSDLFTPSATQIAAGFFNSSIRPNLEMRYYAGFSGVNCQMFSGFIDTWEQDALTRTVNVTARDYYKFLLKPKLTTKLKTSQSLEFLVELIANYKNFPSNLIILDTTTISPAYFMPKDKTVQSVLNELQDATGNAELFFDEFGRLNFRSYLTIIKHIWFQGSQADFVGGTNINNTDATSQPGALVLSNVASVYAVEGNWYSVVSPVLSGKVQFDSLLASTETGPATSVDLFMRVTSDGGATFTPWREILPGTRGILSKWNHWYGQVQIWVRLRTSDTAVTPKLLDFTVRYTSRGGSNRVNDTADWATKDTTTLIGKRRKLTDQVGGANYMVTKAIVKSKPTFVGSGSLDAWQGTYNGAAISASNPLFVPVGTTTFAIDFGETKYDVPQTVVMTLGTAVAVATISSHPSKPTLTITATVAGTITQLKVSGVPFTQNGLVEAISYADDEIVADFGPNEDTLENDYIDNVDLAQSIADNLIAQFGQGPLDWINEAEVRFTPNAQLNDRVSVTDRFSGVASDYMAIGLIDELMSDQQRSFTARTTVELVKIGAGVLQTEAAYLGSGGAFYYSGFRWGGDYTL